MIFLLLAAAWLTAMVLVVAICRIAFRGDVALMSADEASGFLDKSASERVFRDQAAA